MVLCRSLLFACKGFGHLQTGTAVPRSGTPCPTKHGAECLDSLCRVREHETAKMGREVQRAPPNVAPSTQSYSQGKATASDPASVQYETQKSVSEQILGNSLAFSLLVDLTIELQK